MDGASIDLTKANHPLMATSVDRKVGFKRHLYELVQPECGLPGSVNGCTSSRSLCYRPIPHDTGRGADGAAAKRSKGESSEPQAQCSGSEQTIKVSRLVVPPEQIPVPFLVPESTQLAAHFAAPSAAQPPSAQPGVHRSAPDQPSAGRAEAAAPSSSEDTQPAALSFRQPDPVEPGIVRKIPLEPPERLPSAPSLAPHTQAPQQNSDGDPAPGPSTPDAEDEPAADAHAGTVRLQDRYLLEFPITSTDVQQVKDNLKAYTERVEALVREGRAKPDMIANKELHSTLRPQGVYGHIKGIPVGQVFANKGELAIVGLHCNINSGIHSKGKNPAFSVVLSGGYDDKDEGDYVEYCGMGGKDSNGRWVKDQTWSAGNLSLQLNSEQGVPVRVFRRKRKELALTYDGLYKVGDPQHKQNKHGFMECRFTLTGVPGHYHSSERVLFNEKKGGGRPVIPGELDLGRRRARQLFGQDAAAGQAAVEVARNASVRNRQNRGRLVLPDFSKGIEGMPIPVYNAFNSEMPPDDFIYIRDSELTTDGARALAQAGHRAMENGHLTTCGVAHHRSERNHFGAYNKAGLLMDTIDEGVIECPAPCETDACNFARVVSRGVRLPLEIFHTGTARGWGVRCRTGIPAGGYLCSYAGAAITDNEAEALHQQPGHDAYLYDLDHFLQIHYEGPNPPEPTAENPHPVRTDFAKLPPVPQACLDRYAADKVAQGSQDTDNTEAEHHAESHITLDARCRGNIARMINHSCNPSCAVQPVLVAGESGMWYHLAIFALKSIAPLSEISYDYHYLTGHSNSAIACQCGAPDCKGRLT